MRNDAEIPVFFYEPTTEEERCELEHKAAELYADMLSQYIWQMNGSAEQKIELLDAVIANASARG